MPTPKQLYTRALNDIAQRYGQMEDSTAQDITALLARLRADINARLLGTSDYQGAQLRALQANLDALIMDFEAEASATIRQSTASAYDFGGISVSEPLQKLGFSQAFFRPSRSQLNTLVDFSADLITGITGDIRKQVNGNLRQAAVGIITPYEAMDNLTRIFGTSRVSQGRLVSTGVSAKAEMDIRTELQRVYNLSNHAQQLETARDIPGLLKRWLATGDSRTRQSHLQIHNETRTTPIPVDQAFVLKTKGRPPVSVMYPADPRGAAWEVIGCRCRMATIHPEIGVIGSDLDGRVSQFLDNKEK